MNLTYNYSPNFELKKRKPDQIKFIIFHYTGMKKESEAIERLTSIKSKVSCHYLIKNNGEIVVMVPDLYEAWHAGVSSWKNFNSLNQQGVFSDKSLMFTGGFKKMSRSEAKAITENNGGKVLGSISKKLDMLVVGSAKPTKKKVDKAIELEVKIIQEKDWYKLLNL